MRLLPLSSLSIVRLASIAVALTVASVASVATAQTSLNSGRWRFGEGLNGDLAAEVQTELGRGVRVTLAFQCNEGGRYSWIGHEAPASPDPAELSRYIEGFLGAELFIETYKNGHRTDRFRPTGFHRGEGDEVTDARLLSMREADFILIRGAARPIAFAATNSNVALAQYVAACQVLRPAAQ